MTVDIVYKHFNNEEPTQFADGAYCLSGFNGNVFLNFFQEVPHIPKEILYHDSDDMPDVKRREDQMAKSNLPYQIGYGGGNVERFFVSRMQITPSTARQLIQNLQAALDDMEK